MKKDYKSMTVVELKQYAKQSGIKLSKYATTKADIIDSIKKYEKITKRKSVVLEERSNKDTAGDTYAGSTFDNDVVYYLNEESFQIWKQKKEKSSYRRKREIDYLMDLIRVNGPASIMDSNRYSIEKLSEEDVDNMSEAEVDTYLQENIDAIKKGFRIRNLPISEDQYILKACISLNLNSKTKILKDIIRDKLCTDTLLCENPEADLNDSKTAPQSLDSSIKTGLSNEDALIERYESIIKEGLRSPVKGNHRIERQTVFLGKYNWWYGNRKERIEWIVLKDDGDKKLIITKKIIDVKDFNSNNIWDYWENARVRSWLNGVFLNDAFSDEERNRILYTYHDNIVTVYESSNGNLMKEKLDYNSAERIVLLSKEERQKSFEKYASFADSHESDDCPFFPFGKKTYCASIVSDRVFLLSSFEARVFFDNNYDRKTTDTPYARKKQNYFASPDEWWLRDINYWHHTGDSLYCFINKNGSVSKAQSNYYGIRPAMWIKCE